MRFAVHIRGLDRRLAVARVGRLVEDAKRAAVPGPVPAAVDPVDLADPVNEPPR